MVPEVGTEVPSTRPVLIPSSSGQSVVLGWENLFLPTIVLIPSSSGQSVVLYIGR